MRVLAVAGFMAALGMAGCAEAKKAPEAEARAASSEEVALKPQETCPVMGGKIDKTIYADYQGKRVYFCCKGCEPEFEQDPEKYLKVLADRGEAPVAIPPENE